MPDKKSTSPTVAKTTARALKDSNIKSTRSLAGSALSQSERKHKTSKQMENLASKVLSDLRSTKIARQLAANVLAQSSR